MSGGVHIDGNFNTLKNTQLVSTAITDNGQGNIIESQYQNGTPSYQARRSNPSPRPFIDAVGKLDGSAFATGKCCRSLLELR